jgi:hypothetical protein
MCFLIKRMKVYRSESLLTSLDKEAYFHMNQKFHRFLKKVNKIQELPNEEDEK